MEIQAENVVDAVKKVVACFKDGFEFKDILVAVQTACEIAEGFMGVPGPEKKKFVCEVVEKAYREVEPDIPWVPEPVETWVENYILKNLVPYAVDMLVNATKGKTNINKG